MIDLDFYAFRVPTVIDGEYRLLIPHSDPEQYDQPVNEIFPTAQAAANWVTELGYDDDMREERWVLMHYTGERVDPDTGNRYTISHQGFVVGHGKHPGHCTSPTHPEDFPRDFEGRAPGMDRCHSCWYGETMGEADKGFEPLIAALVAGGIDRDDITVDQTGGMVMCLRIVVERGEPFTERVRAYEHPSRPEMNIAEHDYTWTPQRYVYVSEPGEFEFAGFGYYDDIHASQNPSQYGDTTDCEGTYSDDETIPFDDWPRFGEWLAGLILWKRAELT